MTSVLVIAILLAFGYVLLVRPAQRRNRAHSAMQDGVVVGDEVISAGGIHGIVREADEDEIRLEIAPGVVVTLDRRAIAAVAVHEEPEEDAEDAEDEPEADSEAPAGLHEEKPEAS